MIFFGAGKKGGVPAGRRSGAWRAGAREPQAGEGGSSCNRVLRGEELRRLSRPPESGLSAGPAEAGLSGSRFFAQKSSEGPKRPAEAVIRDRERALGGYPPGSLSEAIYGGLAARGLPESRGAGGRAKSRGRRGLRSAVAAGGRLKYLNN
jgi:hypothetical protein